LFSGCGESTEANAFYYKPTWTRDGKIICVKGLQSLKKDFLGSQTGSSYHESVIMMSAAGTGETYLFDVSSAPPSRMTCSPTGDYLAYLDDLRGDWFYRIVVRNIASGVHLGLDKVEIVFTKGIVSFDWSSDGTKLVYCTTEEICTIGVNGAGDTLVAADAALEFVSWKNGGRIAFIRTVGTNKILSLIKPDGSGRLDQVAAASVDLPQISAINTNEVFGIAGGAYCRVDVSALSPATVEVIAGFRGDLPRLSQAADNIVYSKTGETSGIYISNINTKQENKLR